MKKVQVFYIRKFDSSRLKEVNYKLKNLTYEQCFLNGEIINISDSQLVRTLYRLTNREFSEVKLQELKSKKKALSRKPNSIDNKRKIRSIIDEINSLLFIPEVISIQFDDKRHFQNIVDKGLFINGRQYVYFMASAGQTRRDQALFIDKEIKSVIDNVFNNGRNINKELVPQKYTAYYSLYSSSSQKVTFPRICVVPDVTIRSVKTVNFSTYISPQVDPLIEEKTEEFEFNGADGQGIMTPDYAKTIGYDLELGYTPSAAIIRCSFMKGLLVAFDVVDFAEKVAKNYFIKDAYGNMVDVRNIDVLISQSQFKLWDSYFDTEDYVKSCKFNNLDFSISRVTPKEDKTSARSSYQFLQVLNFDNSDDLKNLCRPTIDWLNGVSGQDINSALIFLLGETNFNNENWFQFLDYPLQALILENELIKDSFFVNYLNKNIVKKKNDAKLGRLIFNSNYSFMIADPYGQLVKLFELNKEPLLKEFEHYSNFWNVRGVKQAVGIRSPIVHASEIDVLNFQNNEEVNYWYKHINTGSIIFPLNGVGLDFVITGGADVDGDLICTIHHESFIKGKPNNVLPVMYESKKAPKVAITSENEDVLIRSQISQIKSNKIGFYTNLASTYTAMLDNFEKDSVEYKSILNRLFYFRIIQGENIDSTKGIVVNPFLQYWVKWKKITPEMTQDEVDYHTFNNKLLAEKRPYFFVHLYPHYMKRYKKVLSVYDNISKTKWNIPFKELITKNDVSPDQRELIEKYHKRTYFINNNSTMNTLSKHIETELQHHKLSPSFSDYSLLVSKNFKKPSQRLTDKMRLLFKEYKSLKKSIRESHDGSSFHIDFSTLEQIYSYINAKAYSSISSSSEELADISLYLSYEILGKMSRKFCWDIFGEEIVNNIKSKKSQKYVRVPIISPKGSVEYLWNRYGMYLMNIEENDGS